MKLTEEILWIVQCSILIYKETISLLQILLHLFLPRFFFYAWTALVQDVTQNRRLSTIVDKSI